MPTLGAFRHGPIRGKLPASVLLVALLAGLVGYFGFTRIQRVAGGDVYLCHEAMTPLEQLSTVEFRFYRVCLSLLDYILADERERAAFAETSRPA